MGLALLLEWAAAHPWHALACVLDIIGLVVVIDLCRRDARDNDAK